jgi:SAM-dependent methyltransferase
MSAPEEIDPSNTVLLGNWDGETGAFWAEHADEFDRGVDAYRTRFLDAAGLGADDRVLDVGCGAGQSTRDAARRAHAGSVLGVDLSSQLIELARHRAVDEGLTNVDFVQADAQVHPFSAGEFDVAISRHGAMFFGDPVAAFTNIARALRPGGRLVLLTWQSFERNEFLHAVLAALAAGRPVPVPPVDAPSPFALSDPARVRSLLTAAGFADIALEDVRAPMNFGSDPEQALRYLSGQHAGMLRDLDTDTRARALAELRASLEAHRGDRGVRYDSAAWLVTSTRPE